MKTVNKQQLVILMLLVIPSMIMIVTITTTQIANAKANANIGDDFNQGFKDGTSNAHKDFVDGTDNGDAKCDKQLSPAYCAGNHLGYDGRMTVEKITH